MRLRLEALELRENPAGPVSVDPIAPPPPPENNTPVEPAPAPAPEPAPSDPIPVDPTQYWW